MILSASSMRVGIKRRAMVIIMANSCAGKPILLNGFKTNSMASVRAMGEVVKVNTEVDRTRSTRRAAKRKP